MIGDRIKLLREDSHLSQIALAQTLGVSKSAISMWETGKREPDSSTMIRIANFFNVSMDYLTGRSNIKHSSDLHSSFNKHSTLENDALDFGPLILKPERKRLEISAKEVGDAVGLTESDILGIEEGDIPIDYETASRIAGCYFSDIAQLLFDYGCYYDTVPEEYGNMISEYEKLKKQAEEDALEDLYKSYYNGSRTEPNDDSIVDNTRTEYESVKYLKDTTYCNYDVYKGEFFEEGQHNNGVDCTEIITPSDIKSLGYDQAALVKMIINSMLGKPLEQSVPIYSATVSELIDSNGGICGSRNYYKPETEDCKSVDLAVIVNDCFYEPDFHIGDILLIHRQDAIPKNSDGVFIYNRNIYIEKYIGKERYHSLLSQTVKYREVFGDSVVDEMISNSICVGKIVKIIRAEPKSKEIY